jgi:hypothetical protein
MPQLQHSSDDAPAVPSISPAMNLRVRNFKCNGGDIRSWSYRGFICSDTYRVAKSPEKVMFGFIRHSLMIIASICLVAFAGGAPDS